MQIEFVNHASVVIDIGNVRIMSDPWTIGKAFDNGWALLSETCFSPQDYAHITHIWYSHEHPDHFSVPTLKSIPEEYRANITILFQHTRDKKVAKYCRKLGFQDVIELPLGTWYSLDEGVELLCNNYHDGWGGADSWLCVRTPEATVLNLNDCDVVEQDGAKAISQAVGKVDLLLTQFSYASWQGNIDDVASRQAYAREKLDEVKLQTQVIGPDYVIPFASFVWFCHRDNFYLNKDVNRIDDVRDFIARETDAQPVIMYPGDVWELSTDFDSDSAVSRYLEDYARVDALDTAELPCASSLIPDELQAACLEFQQKLVAHSSSYAVRSSLSRQECDEEHRIGNYTPLSRVFRKILNTYFPRSLVTTVYITDHEQAYQFAESGGLKAVDVDNSQCDIATTSESLQYAFNNLFGGQSLAINGRFQECRTGGHFSFFRLFKLSFRINEGFMPNLNPLN